MADDTKPETPSAPSDAAAWAALSAASREKADAFLEEQRKMVEKQQVLLDLQAHELKHELTLNHWSVRVRHLSDVMKVVFELAVAVVALVLLAGIGEAIWTAANDDSLVIESFQVPPDFAARGLSGDVLAADVIDKAGAFEEKLSSAVGLVPVALQRDTASEIRVQIPDTGISVGELYAYLVRRLGRERRISGALYRSGDQLTLTVRVPGAGARSFTGHEVDFARIEQEGVEYLVAQTQPELYAQFLSFRSVPAAITFLTPFAEKGPGAQRAAAYETLDYLLQYQADYRRLVDNSRTANEVDPEHAAGYFMLSGAETVLGQDEAALRDTETAERLLDANVLDRTATASSKRFDQLEFGGWQQAERGDFNLAARDELEAARLPFTYLGANPAPYILVEYLVAQHDLTAARRWLAGLKLSSDAAIAASNSAVSAELPPMPRLRVDIAAEDWTLAAAEMHATWSAATRPGAPVAGTVLTFFRPWYALTEAMTGRNGNAQHLIASTPPDCYICLRVRARIDERSGNLSGAAFWFGRSVAQAPSVPFAYLEWGAMLLHEGKVDAAIEKFREANLKGPHFADPLEMWGEALMQENRSDLAITKFKEADKYAPNWGRLHLEWGKALSYVGTGNEAKKQFAMASALDLWASDRAALDRWLGHN